jgi:hypothetical protein
MVQKSTSFMGKRYFTTSRPLLTATTSAPALQEKEDMRTLLFGKWPIYPLLALGALTGVSKEILILNDEMLFAGVFLAFAVTAYVQIGEDLSNYLGKELEAEHEQQLAACDIAIDAWKRFITIENRKKSFPEDVKALYEEEVKMAHMAVDYQNKKHQIDVKDAVLQKLTQIKALEDEEAREYKNALISNATAYVQERFATLPAKEKSTYIDAIIDTLPSNKGMACPEVENDPAFRLFAAFLEENYTPEELGVVNRVSTYVNKKDH